MMGNSGLLAAVLTVVSVLSLSLLSALCLRCKKKNKIIHEEHQIYDPQTFQRGGSKFAVTQSKTVTRANHITSTIVETLEEFGEYSADANDEQSDYINVIVTEAQTGNHEHTYVDPLPITVYDNEKPTEGGLTDSDQNPAVYGNIITPSPIKDDDDDYENSAFLEQVVKEQEDDEPDYVNENG